MEELNVHSLLQLMQKKKELQSLKQQYTFQGEKNINKVKFCFQQSEELWNILLSNSAFKQSKLLSLYPSLLPLCQSNQKRSVCAKLVANGELIAQCYNCRQDSSCIICYECYKNGNHGNHKVIFKKAYGGCCDCGDDEAWKKQGFCKNHSGQVIDSPIEQHTIRQFCNIMQDLFYIFYRLKLTGQKAQKAFFTALIDVLKVVIEKGVKGIKLLSIFLQSCPSADHFTNIKLQKEPFIHHAINSKFAGVQKIEWQHLFINMFPYYQFKKQLLAAYVNCFAEIYQVDLNDGSSLSCQILTSYKLIQNYVQTQGNKPLGYDLLSKIQKLQKAETLSLALCGDLGKINSLEGGVPYKYWKFHIGHGIQNLFIHYQFLKNQFTNFKAEKANSFQQLKRKNRKKKKQMGEASLETNQNLIISFIIRHCSLFQNEYCWLSLMHETLSIISKDKELVLQLINKLYFLIVNDQNQDFIIFRPYDRVFALAVFSYVDWDLLNLQKDQYQKDIRISIGLGAQQWSKFISRLTQRMLSTFMFLSHILTNQSRGFISSFKAFTYFYVGKDNLMGFLDILQLKMALLLAKETLNINFEQLIRMKFMDSKNWSLNHLTVLMQEIGLLYTTKMPQIYVSFYENRSCELYKDQIMLYLKKYLNNNGGTLGLDQVRQFAANFLFSNQNLLTSYLRQISTYDKDRKLFKLKQTSKQEEFINFNDFTLRTKLINKEKAAEKPKFTTQFIADYNKQIFLSVWNPQNLRSIKKIMMSVYEELKVQKQLTKDQLSQFFKLVCKFVSLLIHCGVSSEKVDSLKELLLEKSIPAEVMKELGFYKQLLGEGVEQNQQQQSGKLREKKEMLEAKRRQKLLKLKNKQQLNLDSAKLMHTEELQRLKSEGQVQQYNQFCVICRNKDESQHQMVYLAKLCVRDLQKLLKLGKGVITLSFTTCYHVFHYKCIQTCSVSSTNLEIVLRCPICRGSGNILLPVDPLADPVKSKPFVTGCLENILQVVMSMKNYQQIDPIEELVKSFYHYVLLGLFQRQYLRTKRQSLYRTLLKLLSNEYFGKQILELKSKLRKSQINLRPKLLADEQKNLRKVDLRDREVGQSIYVESDSEDDGEYQEYLQYLRQISNSQMQEEQNNIVGDTQKDSDKKKRFKKYLQSRKLVSFKRQDQTNIFQFTLRKILQYLSRCNNTHQVVATQKQQQQQQTEWVWPEVSTQVKIIIAQLLQEEYDPNYQFKLSKFAILELPKCYNWDMSKNICRECNQLCFDTMICLLCDWRGCLRCQSGGLLKHTRNVHGQMSAVMRLNDAEGYLIGSGQIMKIGCLYANEWGNTFHVKKQWQEYFLQEEVYQKIVTTLFRDE